MRTSILVSRLVRALEASDPIDNGSELADAYADAVRAANRRLEEVQIDLETQQISDAIYIMERDPRLLDEISALDFPQLPKWIEKSQELNWTLPPALDHISIDRILEVYDGITEVEPFLKLNRHAMRANDSLLAVQSLRQIIKRDSSRSWQAKLVEAEKTLQRQWTIEFRSFREKDDWDNAERLEHQIRETAWSELLPKQLEDELQAFCKALEIARKRGVQQNDLRALKCAVKLANLEKVKSLLSHLETLESQGVTLLPEGVVIVQEGRDYCEKIRRYEAEKAEALRQAEVQRQEAARLEAEEKEASLRQAQAEIRHLEELRLQEELRRHDAERSEATAKIEALRQEKARRQEAVRLEAAAKAEALRQEELRREEASRREAEEKEASLRQAQAEIRHLEELRLQEELRRHEAARSEAAAKAEALRQEEVRRQDAERIRLEEVKARRRVFLRKARPAIIVLVVLFLAFIFICSTCISNQLKVNEQRLKAETLCHEKSVDEQRQKTLLQEEKTHRQKTLREKAKAEALIQENHRQEILQKEVAAKEAIRLKEVEVKAKAEALAQETRLKEAEAEAQRQKVAIRLMEAKEGLMKLLEEKNLFVSKLENKFIRDEGIVGSVKKWQNDVQVWSELYPDDALLLRQAMNEKEQLEQLLNQSQRATATLEQFRHAPDIKSFFAAREKLCSSYANYQGVSQLGPLSISSNIEQVPISVNGEKKDLQFLFVGIVDFIPDQEGENSPLLRQGADSSHPLYILRRNSNGKIKIYEAFKPQRGHCGWKAILSIGNSYKQGEPLFSILSDRKAIDFYSTYDVPN